MLQGGQSYSLPSQSGSPATDVPSRFSFLAPVPPASGDLCGSVSHSRCHSVSASGASMRCRSSIRTNGARKQRWQFPRHPHSRTCTSLNSACARSRMSSVPKLRFPMQLSIRCANGLFLSPRLSMPLYHGSTLLPRGAPWASTGCCAAGLPLDAMGLHGVCRIVETHGKGRVSCVFAEGSLKVCAKVANW